MDKTYQESISPTVYEQLFGAQIPKAKKDTGDLAVFMCFLDLRMQKLLEIYPRA
jgi:hypothetical protein